MGLQPGTKLGPYRIERSAGAGGMGEVYLASDTRLGRSVAVKVLPESLADSDDARARLEREARSVSSLSHPNICALYDVGHVGGVDYLVMEYLEGDTLAARLESGPLPADEALRVAQQVIDGLAVAHRQGVIHRDLKPGNVMLTPTGAKLLDFGLAKALNAGRDADPLTAAPTATTPLTATGTIMGTIQYMSPEQLEGKEADARSDLFAFGALLYEMLTGQRPFQGGSQASLVAAILTEQPRPVSALAPAAPPGLDRLVGRCLVKNPDERWHSATDLGHELRAIAEGSSGAVTLPAADAAAVAPARATRARLPWALAGLFLISTVALGILGLDRTPVQRDPIAFEVHPPEGEFLRPTGGFAAPPAVSPDGTKIVYGTFEPSELNRLWLRELGSTEPRALPGTENAVRPFWSADSRWVGFFSQGQLLKVEVAGGTPLPICPAPDARGGTWSAADVIVFAPGSATGLSRVSANGGEPEPVTDLLAAPGHHSHRYPSFLDGTDRFVYLVVGTTGATGTGAEADNQIWTSSLSDPEPRLVLQGAANAQYANGELLFFRGGALMGRGFDLTRGEFSGEIRTVVPEIQYDAAFERGIFSTSEDLLVYRAGSFRGWTTLRWHAPDGRELDLLAPAGSYSGLAVSPDDRRVAVAEQRQGNAAIWIYDLSTGQRNPLSFEKGSKSAPRWSPDNRRVAYLHIEDGDAGWALSVASASGEGAPLAVLRGTDSAVSPLGWTADGSRILFYMMEEDSTAIGRVEPRAGAEPEWLFRLPGVQLRWFRVSPDNRWFAYSSSRSGRWEVYVTSFPDGEGTLQVSTSGGLEPVWTADGKALYFRAGGRAFWRADVEDRGGVLRVTAVRPALEVLSNWSATTSTTYDVAGDGRLLISVMEEAEARVPLTAVLNWR
jgi:Tol biopolymer transport system component/Ser/Thr protein kinase RdoA (MazF antagonist)